MCTIGFYKSFHTTIKKVIFQITRLLLQRFYITNVLSLMLQRNVHILGANS